MQISTQSKQGTKQRERCRHFTCYFYHSHGALHFAHFQSLALPSCSNKKCLWRSQGSPDKAPQTSTPKKQWRQQNHNKTLFTCLLHSQITFRTPFSQHSQHDACCASLKTAGFEGILGQPENTPNKTWESTVKLVIHVGSSVIQSPPY